MHQVPRIAELEYISPHSKSESSLPAYFFCISPSSNNGEVDEKVSGKISKIIPYNIKMKIPIEIIFSTHF